MFKFFVILIFTISTLFSLDISTATKEDFMNIKGIGSVIAERIIKYRSENGLNDPNELINVRGIGPAKLQKIKSQLSNKKSSGVDLSKYR
jgi:competence protein ComEA